MATGLIYGTTNHPSGQLEVRISYWQNNINVGANTSQVGADLYARRKDGYETWGSWSGRVNVGGSWSQTITRQVTVGASWVHLGSYSRTLTHNDDGTRPVYFSADGGISGVGWTTTSIGQTVQMDAIPRRSVPTLSTSTPVFGESWTIYSNRKSSAFMHNLRVQFGSRAQWIADHRSMGGSVSWAMPLEWLDQIPNHASGTGTLTLHTFDAAGNEIGQYAIHFYPRVPASAAPSITSLSVSDTSPAHAAIGAYVLGVSKLRLEIVGAAAKYGATIASQSTHMGGASNIIGAVGVHTPDVAGLWNVSGRVTDSRGQATQLAKQAEVLPYTRPKATMTVERCLSNGVPNPLGTYLRVTTTGSASSLKPAGTTTEKNSLTRILRYRKRGTTAWTTARTDTISGLSWAATGHTIGGGTITATDAWEVQVEAADKVASAVTQLTVTTAGVAMSWGRVGVGIGKIFEQGNNTGLDLAGNLWWDGVPQSKLSHHATVAARDLAHPTPAVGQLATTGTGAAMQVWKYSGAAGWVELVDESLHAVTLGAGWTLNAGSTADIVKHGRLAVFNATLLFGTGASFNTIFTLPVAVRPTPTVPIGYFVANSATVGASPAGTLFAGANGVVARSDNYITGSLPARPITVVCSWQITT